MSRNVMKLLLIAIVAFPAMFGGCSGGGKAIDPVSHVDKEDGLADARSGLLEMGEMFKYFDGENIKPPKKAAEFAKHDVLFPVAGVLLPTGKIVYHGGSYAKVGEPKLLGYEAGAATSGGWILLSNGEVKEVTAQEFATVSGGK